MGREKTGFWLLNRKINLSAIFFYLLILFLPTQLGKHFWPNFSYVYGVRIDYLSPTLYFTDILIIGLFLSWILESLVSSNGFLKAIKTAGGNIIRLLILFFTIVTLIFWGDDRFRSPIEPVLVIFAAYGMAQIFKKIKNRF